MLSAVSRSSSSRPRGALRCVERCWPSAAQVRRSDTPIVCTMCSTQARRRAGLRSFPARPPPGSACPRSGPRRRGASVRSPPPAPSAAPPARTSAPELPPPAVVCDLGHPDRPDRLRHGLPLRDQDIHLPQLGQGFLRPVLLARHLGPPPVRTHTSGRTTSKGDNQYPEAGVGSPAHATEPDP